MWKDSPRKGEFTIEKKKKKNQLEAVGEVLGVGDARPDKQGRVLSSKGSRGEGKSCDGRVQSAPVTGVGNLRPSHSRGGGRFSLGVERGTPNAPRRRGGRVSLQGLPEGGRAAGKGGGRPEESASTNSVTPQSLMEDLGISLGTQTWDNPMSVLEDGTRFSWQGKRG